MTDKEIIIDGVDVSGCPFLDEWKHCNLCKEFAKIQNRHLLIEADLRCEEQPSELCYYKQLSRKTAECEELKAQLETYSKMLDNSEFKIALTDVRTGEREVWRKLGNKAQRYEQALDDIEGLAKKFCKDCGDSKDCNDGKAGCYYSLIPDLFNIISKAKDGNNE